MNKKSGNNKSGMGRMLSYMFVYAQRVMLFFIIFMVAWTVYMGLIGGMTLEMMLPNIPLYVVFICGLSGMIFTMGYIPLMGNGMLSMGATRKEVTCGIIFAHAIISVEMAIFGCIVHAICNKGVTADTFLYLALVLGTAFVSTGLGMAIAVMVDRFGKVAYYIMVAIVALLAGVAGGFGSYMIFNENGAISLALPINVLAMLGGIVLFVVGALVVFLGFRRKVVNV